MCSHPDHVDGVSCEDRAIACADDCVCCLGPCAAGYDDSCPSGESHREFADDEWAFILHDRKVRENRMKNVNELKLVYKIKNN